VARLIFVTNNIPDMFLKKISFLTIAFFCVLLVHSQSLIVGSFNLRYDNPRDTGNLWVNRAPIVASLIQFHEFDVLGTQEGLRNQLDDIKTALPEYTYYGIGRDDGQAKGEYSAIFYKTAKFNLLKSGDFWLSTTRKTRTWLGCTHQPHLFVGAIAG
jgi:hypothetical protein